MENLRRKHTPSFKAKVALEAIREQKTSAKAGQSVPGSSQSDQELENCLDKWVHFIVRAFRNRLL